MNFSSRTAIFKIQLFDKVKGVPKDMEISKPVPCTILQYTIRMWSAEITMVYCPGRGSRDPDELSAAGKQAL